MSTTNSLEIGELKKTNALQENRNEKKNLKTNILKPG
jgi:hypothetical protein